ncbi:hypothetical protein D3C81_1717080 [compost metagenome]
MNTRLNQRPQHAFRDHLIVKSHDRHVNRGGKDGEHHAQQANKAKEGSQYPRQIIILRRHEKPQKVGWGRHCVRRTVGKNSDLPGGNRIRDSVDPFGRQEQRKQRVRIIREDLFQLGGIVQHLEIKILETLLHRMDVLRIGDVLQIYDGDFRLRTRTDRQRFNDQPGGWKLLP